MKKNKIIKSSGIMPYFFNAQGEKVQASEAVKQKILACFEGKISSRRYPLPKVKVWRQNCPCFIRLQNANAQKPLQGKWLLQLENGEQIEGKIKKDTINLPRNLPLGYHQLRVKIKGKDYSCTIIIAPQRCYQPQSIKQGKKLWGTFLQLYSLRSEQNWGMGDFGDLYNFIAKLQGYQADFIGLNPIHALFPANPDSASPYSPSSRRWLNIAYIDVNAVAEFQQSAVAQQWFQGQDVQAQLKQLRAENWVNYAKVIPLKLKGLRLAFDYFCQVSNSQDFDHFVQQGGESLQVQATFDALHAYLMANFSSQWGWNFWAEQYQNYHSQAVQQFAVEHQQEVRFYAWLQFVADQQLKKCHQLCQQKMSIGLYRDLAVGVTGSGSESWDNQSLYCLRASVGAPPDILGPQGQNWGLVPMNPHSLQDQAYQPFIELVRSNMQHCGALRLDHIMSLLRLWWIPQGGSAKNGVYVRYPVDDLLAILALESQRHHCLIIGEDLGTVPREIVQKLKDAGILSYKIFYFEFDQQGNSKALADYPYQAMTTLSTHDLPTINGYWKGHDFELGQQFGVYPNPQILAILKQDRINAKQKILARLQQAGIEISSEISPQLNSAFSKAFNHQLQSYVAGVNSALFGFQPEDWLDMTEPVNIPGTSNEYPNWRRKLVKTVEEIFADPEIQQLLNQVNQIRRQMN